MKYVTIATDISCEPKYKITTWACYIRYGGGVIKRSGEFKQFYKNTGVAETYALINALTIARREIKDWHESRVIIYNEIEYALDPITTKAGNVRKRDEERADQIRNIALPILSQALEWERRKIKAHMKDWRNSDNPKKYAINVWCDKESRRIMRLKKQQLKRLR